MKGQYLVLFFIFMGSLAHAKTNFIWGIRSDLVYFKKQAAEFQKEIAKKTKGEVQIQIVSYPEDEEKNTLATEWINSGRFDITQEVTGRLDSLRSEFRIWSLPFLFRDDAHVEKYIQTIGQDVLKKSETENLLPIDYSFSGVF